jgi:hypothetical protein
VTLVAVKTVAHAVTSAIAQRDHRLVIDQLARALVIDHHARSSVTVRLVQAEVLVAEASARSVDPDLAVAAPADQRNSVLSADHKNILSNTFRQDVFP